MATTSVTSSPESVCGRTPCEAQAGLTTDPSGPALAPASLSARQAKAAGLLTSDTSGLRGIGLSASDALAWSLASKLRVETDLLGSTLYELTWKQRVTPSGRSIYALRASVRRTSGRESTFAPSALEKTPQASDGDGGVMEIREGSAGKYKLRDFAALASWPTPRVTDEKNGRRKTGNRTEAASSKAGWTLPEIASWPTPKVADGERGGHGQAAMNALSGTPRPSGAAHSHNLTDYAQLATGWPTPNAMEGGQTIRSGERRDEMLMGGMVQPSPEGPARLTASGVMLTGSDAGMDGGGQLNQALPRWLQAIPAEWGQAALEAHQKLKAGKAQASTRTRPPRSQKA